MWKRRPAGPCRCRSWRAGRLSCVGRMKMATASRPGRKEAPLLRLADLAGSIRQDGLTNPITVVKTGDTHVIETGERRWVAFHLLNAYIDGDDYQSIPARRMPELNLWRQASENTARDALNAIARARQIALLLMDMHGWEHFAAIEDFRTRTRLLRAGGGCRELAHPLRQIGAALPGLRIRKRPRAFGSIARCSSSRASSGRGRTIRTCPNLS